MCNSGIIDIGGRTIIFDTFISPEAARDLLKVAKQLTSSRITLIVNNHEHSDHIRGNQVFDPDVDIINTTLAREAITRNEPEKLRLEKRTIRKDILGAQAKLDAETDPKRQRKLTLMISEMEGVERSHQELKTRPPNITFENKLTIYGPERILELLPLSGHTPSDIVLFLPRENCIHGRFAFYQYTSLPG